MSSSTTTSADKSKLQYIDAGANLLDSMYQGVYHGKERHEPDLDIILARAYENGVDRIISMAGTPKECEETLQLIERLDKEHNSGDNNERVKVFGTVGVHPTRCAEVFAESCPSSSGDEDEETTNWIPKTEAEQTLIISQMIKLINQGKTSGNVVAVGEFGLDYARLHFCPKDIQQLGFRKQLEMAIETKLPLYLHNRDSGDDLYDILLEYRDALVASQGGDEGNIRGIVHSFDESIEVATKLMSLGLHIGINGCSLKTPDNLKIVEQIPLDKLILETDCPWCDIRPSHAGFEHLQTTFPTKKEKQYNRELAKDFCVKNRTEPCHVAQVAEVIAGVKGLDVADVVAA
eukprot:CAMPEP_0113371828 /NCGR_PEP_ID=MMETSP0013_2-20120614/215_1 /TAXON_ID=2843 ORGANISM="Skeletonema costatum, Strain 1716" /NCGR_SAMPLE_ID=MMETSP0013_2 /ASSEMBLY_ACC=CAM_ASM_000158 /LENGTH=346 /DNA_ID=CAMNT_0000253691 /DNA_START=148 /DNA_END=1185 /DNA_ORIENTATION=+ /assembly_acc=CAM_ASM_000158